MLSPGTFHKYIPRDLAGNYKFRRDLLLRCKGDKVFQSGIREMCRLDILFYINAFVWQFNPKKQVKDRVGPFITWRAQERLLLDRPETTGKKGILWCHENGKSAVLEKSRELGASWLFLIDQSWHCIFHNRTQILNISKSADAVDCKSPDSLFWKLRFLHEHLPDWLKGSIIEEKMYIEYERTKSVNTGEASTGRAGVGGRGSTVFIDEFPMIKEDVEVRERTAGTADVRFFNGTHQGVDTEFYRLTQTPEIVQMQLHWTRHPEKNQKLYCYDKNKESGPGIQALRYDEDTDTIVPCPMHEYPEGFQFNMSGAPTGGPHPGVRSPWYDNMVVQVGGTTAAAKELDISPSGSVQQFFDPMLIQQLKAKCSDPFWEGDITFEKETGTLIAFVEREGGPLKLWCHLRNGMPPRSTYGAGSDVSGGTGATPSCLAFTDGRTGEMVAEYANAHIDPKEFGALAVALCRAFCDEEDVGAKLAWENHGPGVTFGKTVWQTLGYRQIFFKTKELTVGQEISDAPGWNPSGQAWPTMLADFRHALQTRRMWVRSVRALEETLQIKYDVTGKLVNAKSVNRVDPSSARENHADRVVAMGLSWKMIMHYNPDYTEAKKEEAVDVRSLAGRRKLREEQERESESWV